MIYAVLFLWFCAIKAIVFVLSYEFCATVIINSYQIWKQKSSSGHRGLFTNFRATVAAARREVKWCRYIREEKDYWPFNAERGWEGQGAVGDIYIERRVEWIDVQGKGGCDALRDMLCVSRDKGN